MNTCENTLSEEKTTVSAKSAPSQFGAWRPYALAHRGMLKIRGEDRKDLLRYIETYKKDTLSIITLMIDTVNNPLSRELAYYLIMPSVLPEDIKENALFKDELWPKIKASSDYPLWRTVSGDKGHTNAEIHLSSVMASQKWTFSKNTGDKFKEILEPWPIMIRRKITAQACAVVKGYLSSVENWKILQNNNKKAIQNLLEKHEAFFDEYTKFSYQNSIWRQCSRMWYDIRQEYTGKDSYNQLTVSQKQAMWECRDKNYLLASCEKPIDTLNEFIIPSMVKKMVKAFDPEKLSKPDRFERIGNPKRLLTWCKSTYVMNKLINIYCQTEESFTAEELNEMLKTEVRNNRRYHSGWEYILKSKNSKHKKMVKFFKNEVQEYIKANRQSNHPTLDVTNINPRLEEGDYWKWIEGDTANANEFRVCITLPKYKNTEKREITAVYRGKRWITDSISVTPFSIKNGMTQFIPNRVKIEGKQKTWFKLQAMTLRLIDGNIESIISSMCMTQTQNWDATQQKELLNNVKVGQKIVVLDYIPGGAILYNAGIFEKTKNGFKLIPSEFIKEYDNGRHGKRFAQFYTTVKANSYLKQETRRHEVKINETTGNTVEINSPILQRWGKITTNSGSIWAKKQAAMLAQSLKNNNVSLVLLCGGGSTIMHREVQAPTRKFFDPTTISGSLIDEMNKIGVPVVWKSRKATSLFVEKFVKTEKFADIKPISSDKGYKKYFPKNSLWACLLYAINEDFKKEVDKFLKNIIV